MGPAPFHKYEGLGNDFIVVEAGDERDVTPARAVELCDRRRGIGADGVLLVLPSGGVGGGAARMRVINADGSIPEMCGNGVRCVALHLARARGLRTGDVRVDTDAGLRVCSLEAMDDAAGEAMVTVDMGVVRVLGDHALADLAGFSDLGESRGDLTYTVADAGNPHAVLFGTFARTDVDRLGPRLATHPTFPKGTNVEFSRVAPDGGIDLVVWERGVGVTLACGTGACATAAVACARGLAPRNAPVAVRLPGGRLDITIDPTGRATMRGPARHVFAGTV